MPCVPVMPYLNFTQKKEINWPGFTAASSSTISQTIYAYLILGKDPNELKKDEEDFIYAYEGLFNAYADKQYETSLGFSEYLLAQSQFNDNPAIDLAKLHYIRGMSYGFTGAQDSLLNILTRVVNTYPEHEVTPVAQKTLNYIQNGIRKRKSLSARQQENQNL